MEPLKSSYRAGTTIRIKAYPVTEVSLHVFVNNVEIPMNYYSASKYWECKFVMPKEDITVHLTYDNFYGRDEYEFDELCNDLHRLENEISVTSDTTRWHEIQFYYIDQANRESLTTLYFIDNYYQWSTFGKWQAFRFEDENYVIPTIENPDLVTYSFQYDGLSSDVRRYDDESFSLKYFNIDRVEFVLYIGPEINVEPTFYLDSRYGKINLLTSTSFELDGVFYEIVSNAGLWAYTNLQLETR